MPKPEILRGWAAQVPVSFLFSLKANRVITHTRKLNARALEPWKQFIGAASVLGKQLGPILLQLPPGWGANPERLDAFLQKASIPKRCPHARLVFEFRDKSWFSEAVYAVLRKHRAGLVLADMPGIPTPSVITTDIVYFRLHGSKRLYGAKYTKREIEHLAVKIKSLRRTRTVYAYFDNDAYGYAPTNALELKKSI